MSTNESAEPTRAAGPPSELVFVVLALALSWACWAPLVIAAWRSGGAAAGWSYLHLVGAWGPALAAVIAASLHGPETRRALLARLHPRGTRAIWLVLAVLLPIALYAVAAAGLGLAGRGWARAGDIGVSREYASLGRAGYWAANIVFYGYGEEIGWRGYLLDRLQRRGLNALVSALVVGVVWALWHLPLFAFAAGMRAMGPAEAVGWFFSILTGSILMTWLFNSSGGNITVVAIFHGVLDIVMTSPGPPPVANVMGAALTLWGIALVFIAGPAHLAFGHRRSHERRTRGVS